MLIEALAHLLDSKLDRVSNQHVTVHTGGHNWEEIVDVVFCQECNQYHIISERIAGG